MLDTLARLDLAQRLGFLQAQQAAISKNASPGVCNSDETAIQSASIVNKELPKLYEQLLEALNDQEKLVSLIQALSPESMQIQ